MSIFSHYIRKVQVIYSAGLRIHSADRAKTVYFAMQLVN